MGGMSEGSVTAHRGRIVAKRTQAEGRVWWTATCERALRRITVGRSCEEEPKPLPRIPCRLLAVKVHGMGDAVMIRSLLEHLHHRHPGMELGVLAGPPTREVLSLGSPFRVHTYKPKGLNPGRIARSAIEIRSRGYEAVLNFEQGSLAGTAFLRALGIPEHIGFVPVHDSAKVTFLTRPLRFREPDPMWTSFIRAVRLVDARFPEDPPVLPLPVSEEARHFVHTWLWLQERTRPMPSRRVVFHMGSGPGQPFRRWPVERFLELAERLRAGVPCLAVILTGTPPEQPLIQEFQSRFSAPAIDASGLGTLERTAVLLAECDLLVSNDTGVMHLGATMGTPTVGIFGPDSPGRYAPVGPYTAAVMANDIPCSPCSNIYRLLVPGSCANPETIRCLRAVAAEAVIEAARKVVIGSWLEPVQGGR